MKKTLILGIYAVCVLALTACTFGEEKRGNASDVEVSGITTYTEASADGFSPVEGESYLNLTIPDAQGNKVQLSQYVKANKLTLIDCWASWCPPCCREMPNMVALYSKYHEAGLEIVGVSFDDDKSAWLKAVDRMNMTWPQVSELNGWENQMMSLYGVESIPSTFLIDQNGTIIAIDLLGEELDETVAEYLE